ncbi:hypothetical protein, partial [Ensifer soli]|uniref:hypothetical protein n=1 Tax=Ciceribacter sp. sgz301302 TaxID=3342379 RepID=UPI0035BB8155
THATAHSDASSLLPSKLSPVIATFLRWLFLTLPRSVVEKIFSKNCEPCFPGETRGNAQAKLAGQPDILMKNMT